MSSFDTPPDRTRLPPIDARLAPPETRFEVHDGKLVYVPPANRAEGARRSKISALLEIHAGAEFSVAIDMLTRTSETDDIAPNVSVFPAAPDPLTGDRQLEQLSFEIVSTQALASAGYKAAKLAGRGVRRVFAIDVERARALEWSAALGQWCELDPDTHIDDPALATPLPIAALLSDGKADNAMTRALVAKGNPVIMAYLARREAEREGFAEGQREVILLVLAARGLAIDPADRMRIFGERDPDRLGRWVTRAATCATIAEVFADS